jgi:hypothetical protein
MEVTGFKLTFGGANIELLLSLLPALLLEELETGDCCCECEICNEKQTAFKTSYMQSIISDKS